MQPYSDYEIAQRRIAERKRKKQHFRISLVFLVIPMLITFVSLDAGACTIPLSIIAGLFVLANGIDLYYSLPEHAPQKAETEQEMEWLFGKDWRGQASAQAHALAQDRIRERRIEKWRLIRELLLFIPINGLIIVLAVRATFPGNLILAVFALAWLIIFMAHARSTFPTQQMLSKREMAFGETLRLEMSALQPRKSKSKEKPKRKKKFQVGDDGELVDVEDDPGWVEEMLKRKSDGG